MAKQETIFVLTVVLVALICGALDFVRYEIKESSTAQKWAIAASAALVFSIAVWRGVAPVVWHYGNLLLN